jgi:hypothetical protein
VVGHPRKQDAPDRGRWFESQDAHSGPDARQRKPGREGHTDSGGNHGLGFLVGVGFEGDLRLEADACAAAIQGFGDRVVLGCETGSLRSSLGLSRWLLNCRWG